MLLLFASIYFCVLRCLLGVEKLMRTGCTWKGPRISFQLAFALFFFFFLSRAYYSEKKKTTFSDEGFCSIAAATHLYFEKVWFLSISLVCISKFLVVSQALQNRIIVFFPVCVKALFLRNAKKQFPLKTATEALYTKHTQVKLLLFFFSE